MPDSPAPPPPPPDASAPRRPFTHYLLLLIFWTLALLSWLLWMTLILYLLSRLFGAE